MMFHLNNYRDGWPVLIGKYLTGSPLLLFHDGTVMMVIILNVVCGK